MFRSVDWTVTGLSAGVAVLAGAVAYEAYILIPSGSVAEQPKDFKLTSSSVLIPARDRPAVSMNATPTAPGAPLVVFAPNVPDALVPQPSRPAPANTAEAALYPPPDIAPSAKRWDAPAPASTDGNFNDYPTPNPAPPGPRRNPPILGPSANTISNFPPSETGAPMKRRNQPTPDPMAARLSNRPPALDYASLPRNEAKPPVPMIADIWRVETTAKANYFNLGGHVKDGVVDSLASSYLRDALKKHQNFPKLPPQIKAYIEAPSINLAKIAGYRALLGIDDRKMEEEQGVKFVRIANSRGIDLTAPDDTVPGKDTGDVAAGTDVPPLDLGPLDQVLSASAPR